LFFPNFSIFDFTLQISNVSIFLKTSFPFLENSSASFLDTEDFSDISAPVTKDFSPSLIMIKALIL